MQHVRSFNREAIVIGELVVHLDTFFAWVLKSDVMMSCFANFNVHLNCFSFALVSGFESDVIEEHSNFLAGCFENDFLINLALGSELESIVMNCMRIDGKLLLALQAETFGILYFI